jgi:hypothetical protein
VTATGDYTNGFVVTFLDTLAATDVPFLALASTNLLKGGTNEVQTITFDHVPTGGTWRVNWRGRPSAWLAYNANGGHALSRRSVLGIRLSALGGWDHRTVRMGRGQEIDGRDQDPMPDPQHRIRSDL